MRTLFLGLAISLSGTQVSYSDDSSQLGKAAELLRFFDSKDWGPDDLNAEDWKRVRKAEEYLLKNHAVLMGIVENEEENCISCAYALVRSKNPEVVPLYIRLLRQNFFLKEPDGSRMEFGFGAKNGCEESSNGYGSIMAYHLGEIGDKRAVPPLREAAEQGDSGVRKSAYCALYKLGEYSVDEILATIGEISFWGEGAGAFATNPDGPSPDTVLAMIDEVRSRNPKQGIELYDGIILRFPANSREAARAHFSKILCYEDLKKYDLALRQCGVASRNDKLEDYTRRIQATRDRITKRAQQDGADQPATAPESKAEGKEKPKPESEVRPQ